MRDHTNCMRGFYISSRACYWNATRDSDTLDEVMVGLYEPGDGGTSGEWAMRWTVVGEKPTARLESFADSWSALAGMHDVLYELSMTDTNNGSGITVDDFVALLLRLGFEDRTAYTRGDEVTP